MPRRAWGTSLSEPKGNRFETFARVSMPSPDEYRVMADDCLQRARVAETENERRLYLGMARVWMEEALRREKALPLNLPPAPTI